jgi:hypothetical protein
MTIMAAAAPTFEPAAVRQWLAILHGDSPGLIHICSTDDWAGRHFTDVDAATGYVTYLEGQRREGIYVRVTSMRPDLEPWKHGCAETPCGRDATHCPRRIARRGGAGDSVALPALWADLDLAGPGHAEHDLPPDEQAGRAVIAATGLPEPTIWIHSGGGLYPIWLLEQPHVLTEASLVPAQALAKDWQRVVEHAAASLGWRYGRGVGDLARVLRIPGTVNRKEGLARPCRIISGHPARYTVEQLQAALNAAIARITPPPAPQPSVGSPLLGAVDRPAGALAPGEDFNARATWPQVLEPAGWRLLYTQEEVTYWTRPGKPTGISASTNALGTDRLHVFTTSAAPLEGGEGYSKFGAYAALHFGGDHSAAARALDRQGYGTPLPDPAVLQAQLLRDLIPGYGTTPPAATSPPPAAGARSLFDQAATEPASPAPAAPSPPPSRVWAPELDVSNSMLAADWLRDEAGRGKLAGLFKRLDAVVHTPREGEEGYLPLTETTGDHDGPAQVRPVTDSTLASRISYTYGVFREVKRGDDYEKLPALFPRAAARTALDVPDMLPNLRTLRGVIHSPVFRADGSLLEEPGYDPATGLLHLPEPGLKVPAVPDAPDRDQVAAATRLLDEMLAGFPFVSAHNKANYLGCLLTPLLRAMCPPPYKLHAIEAHQPGSGKTLLANLSRWIHGGVFRAEVPEDDTELRKQVTSILSVTTGPVVVLDNLSGALKSSTLAGLLTSAQWDDRPLGSTTWVRCVNDRLWTITGNNLAIGGDLPRRTIRTAIDPGQPNPELRTGFAIDDLEAWVREHRGRLLHALLTLVRGWVAAGMPMAAPRASDGYARWVRTIDGILRHAEINGEFDHRSTQIQTGSDDDDWADFLHAIHTHMQNKTWTVKELLGQFSNGSLIDTGGIPLDALPGDLGDKAARHGNGVLGLAKSLGKWFANREGRWAGDLTIRSAGEDRSRVKLWQIRTSSDS